MKTDGDSLWGVIVQLENRLSGIKPDFTGLNTLPLPGGSPALYDGHVVMIKPKKLKSGDRVAAVSLSWGGAGKFPHRYEAGKRQFEEEFGVQVVESEHALRDPAWLAHNPQARAHDLMAAFADPNIDGIISTIGGEDSIRLLPFLDLDVIRQNPKVFMGYSDTTISHAACFKAGLVSFYGPAFMSGFAENTGMFPYMVESVRKTLFSDLPRCAFLVCTGKRPLLGYRAAI